MLLPAGVGGEAGHETSLDIVHRVPILCVCVCVYVCVCVCVCVCVGGG